MPGITARIGRREAGLAIILLAALLVLPALLMGNALGGDTIVHVNWQAHFAVQLWHGVPWPRWLPDISHGFGSPAFFFYPPVAQWAGALFHPLLPGGAQAMQRLILGAGVTSILGAWGCWRWLRALGAGPAAALFGAACFLLFPYRAIVDFYVRGALAELTALHALPWLFYTATRLCAGRPGGFGGHALAVGVMFYCNFPVAEIGVLFATGYIVAMAGIRDGRTLLRGAAATLCGFLVGAAPIATTLGLFGYLIDTSSLWSPRNSPTNWLLFSGRRWDDPTMQALTIGSLLLSIVGGAVACAIVRAGERGRDLRRAALFLLASILIVALLNTALSRALWFPANPLSRIQFPFRMLSMSTVAVAALAGLAAHTLHDTGGSRNARRRRALLWAALPALLLFDGALLGMRAYRDREVGEPTARQMIAGNMDAMHEFVIGRLDLLDPAFGNRPALALQGRVAVQPVASGNRSRTFVTTADGPARIALRQFAFTGWSCRIDAGDWTPAGRLAYPLNVPTCAVPAGRHQLTIALHATMLERMGMMLTIAGLLLALGSMIVARVRGTRRPLVRAL